MKMEDCKAYLKMPEGGVLEGKILSGNVPHCGIIVIEVGNKHYMTHISNVVLEIERGKIDERSSKKSKS